MLKFVILGVASLAFVGTAVAADLPRPQPVPAAAAPVAPSRADRQYIPVRITCLRRCVGRFGEQLASGVVWPAQWAAWISVSHGECP